MKVIIVPGAPVDSAQYLAEILRATGLCCVECLASQDAMGEADPATDLLILPEGGEVEGLESFLYAGGSAVAIRPQGSVAALAGLSYGGERQKPGRLRITAPICPGARGEALWTLGAQTIYRSELSTEEANTCTLAYLFEPGNVQSESIGAFQRVVGEGTLTVFAYDVADCIARLRQGYPERAGVLPEGETIPRPIYLHEPNAPLDTTWRPTADLHAGLFGDVVKIMLGRNEPVPTLWHIPDGKPALVLFTGDEDGAPQEANESEMAELETYGGTMSLYVIPGDTPITDRHIEEYQRRGHEISVHPDLLPTCGQSKEEQLAKAEADVSSMREKFGCPVETIRTHCTMWPGYLDLPELWERLGIGMDASCFASRYMQSPDGGPYQNVDAALPLRFVREDGSLIDVYQQPTHLSDDVAYHPVVGYSLKFSVEQGDWIIQRMLEDAARWFHTPFCPCIHPGNYVTFSGEQGKALMRRATELDMLLWPMDRWHNFWRARDAWLMSAYSWKEPHLSFTLTGPLCEQLTLTLPPAFEGKALKTLSLNGTPTDFEIVERYRRPIVQIVLPTEAKSVAVAAEYH